MPLLSHVVHGRLIAGQPNSSRVATTATGQQNADHAAPPAWHNRHHPLETSAGPARRSAPAHQWSAEACRQPSQIIAVGAPQPSQRTPVRSAPLTSIRVGVIFTTRLEASQTDGIRRTTEFGQDEQGAGRGEPLGRRANRMRQTPEARSPRCGPPSRARRWSSRASNPRRSHRTPARLRASGARLPVLEEERRRRHPHLRSTPMPPSSMPPSSGRTGRTSGHCCP